MQVDEIRVTFMRKRQPRDYENAMAEITLQASLDDGEDHVSAMQTLLDDASGRVYERLGLSKRAGSDTKESGGKAATGKSGPRNRKSTSTAGPVGETPDTGSGGNADVPDTGGDATADSGTPDIPDTNGDGSPVTGPDAEAMEDQAANVPDDTPEAPDIPDTGSGGNADGPDIPDTGDGDTEPDKDSGGGQNVVMEPGEVQGEITKLVNNKKITVKQIKAILAEYSVSRINEVPKDKLQEFLDKTRAQASQ